MCPAVTWQCKPTASLRRYKEEPVIQGQPRETHCLQPPLKGENCRKTNCLNRQQMVTSDLSRLNGGKHSVMATSSSRHTGWEGRQGRLGRAQLLAEDGADLPFTSCFIHQGEVGREVKDNSLPWRLVSKQFKGKNCHLATVQLILSLILSSHMSLLLTPHSTAAQCPTRS